MINDGVSVAHGDGFLLPHGQMPAAPHKEVLDREVVKGVK